MASQALKTLALVLAFGCGGSRREAIEAPPTLRLATTTTTLQSGLLDALVPDFEARTGRKVEITAEGSGAALARGRRGEADVLLTNAHDAEEQFVDEGFGLNRQDVMYNDFVLLGPPSDPASLAGSTDILEALQKLARARIPYVSRGDESGTNIREKGLLSAAAVTPEAAWFVETHDGMLGTLRKASAKGAYVLSDRSTFLFHRDELSLKIVVEGDSRLFNPYSVVAVSPTKFRDVDFAGAMAFVDFITGPEGQRTISAYGTRQFGSALFTPMAVRETP